MNLIATYKRFEKFPAGKTLFSKVLGRMIPYSNTIHARVENLEAGYAKVVMRDRRAVRNHLNSVHAVALMNLGELASGLAMVGGLPSNLRGILVGYRMEYFKKARGTLTAEARCTVPNVTERQEHILPVDIKNEAGDTVCRAHATWLIGPV